MKPKRLVPFVVVLAVLAALGALKYTRESRRPTLSTQAKLQTIAPEGLAAGDIAKLELYSGAKPDEKVVLEKNGTDWQVTSEFNAPVKAETVDGFLKGLTTMTGEPRETNVDDAKLDVYKLKDDQSFRVRAFKAGSQEPVMDVLAGKAPDFKTVFVRKAGEKNVYVEAFNPRKEAGVTGDDTATAPAADKWLNKEIVKIDREKIGKIALATPDKNIVLEKKTVEVPVPEEKKDEPAADPATPGDASKPDDAPKPDEQPKTTTKIEWTVTANGQERKHKESGLNTLLGRFTALNAEGVVDPAKLADWGLDSPGFKATISVDGADTVLEGGRKDATGDGYVRLASKANVVYKLSKTNFENIFGKGGELFELPKADLSQNDVSRVEINQPEGKVILAKEGDTWKVEEPVLGLDVQTSAITGLTGAIARWTPADYSDTPVADAEFTRSINVVAGAKNRTLRVAGPSKTIDGSYAKLDGSDGLLVINAADLKRIFLKPKDVYSLKVTNIAPSDVAGIDVTSGDKAFSVEKNGEAWTLRQQDGAKAPIDAAAADEFVTGLGALQMKDLVAGKTALDAAPAHAISIRKSDGGTLAVTIGPDANGESQVQVAGRSGVFSLEKTKVDELVGKLEKLNVATGAATAPAVPAGPDAAPSPVPAPEAAPAPAAEAVPTVVMPTPAAEAAPGPPAEGPAAPPMVTLTPAPEAVPAPAPAPESAPAPAAAAEAAPTPAPEVVPAPVPEVTPAPTPEAAPAPAPEAAPAPAPEATPAPAPEAAPAPSPEAAPAPATAP